MQLQHCCVLLGGFGQKCCVRLHGPKRLTGFKKYATSANKCQHCCGSMQMDATCWTQQCCVLSANNVASVCMSLGGSGLILVLLPQSRLCLFHENEMA